MKQFFRRYKLSLLIIIFSLTLGLAPVLSVLIASIIANANDCILHEGNVNPCKIGSVDLGGLLYSMAVSGWFMLVSIPFGLIGLVFGLISLIVQIWNIRH
ncbi:hypothetical protein [Myxosarcina sp. GI1]|uniref:hypothetical protein n=1 Tax=Myxosarcina sp. GI1 TaxID=1541065 RepID=UPI000691380C|nr:hypothetical protein [Myxosarcina sp. GI1]